MRRGAVWVFGFALLGVLAGPLVPSEAGAPALESVVMTLSLVVSVLPFCVSAEAATDFSALVAVLLFRIFAALEATFLLVLSDLAMGRFFLCRREGVHSTGTYETRRDA